MADSAFILINVVGQVLMKTCDHDDHLPYAYVCVDKGVPEAQGSNPESEFLDYVLC